MDAWPDRPRILISYAYLQGHPSLAKFAGDDLIVDSGAFTAWSLGKPVQIEKYADYLVENRKHIDHAVALDVIGDWKQSAKNYDRLASMLAGRVPMVPIWHIGSPLSEMERLCREYDYVAIGGAVPYAKRPKMLMQHLIPAHKIARDAGVKLHGLGVTGKTAMMRLPWYSADSSGWVSSHRFGSLGLKDARGHEQKIQFGKPLTHEHRKIIRAYDGDPGRVASPDFCLISKAGEQGRRDREWAGVSAARSVMFSEVLHRRKHSSPFHVHLVTGGDDYSGWIRDAWSAGTPW